MPPTPPKKTADSDAASGAISLKVDGVTYTVDIGELDHRAELALFRQSGLTVGELMSAMSSGAAAPFMIAALVFLGRLQHGDDVTFDAVAGAINYRSEVEIVTGDDSPKGPAAD